MKIEALLEKTSNNTVSVKLAFGPSFKYYRGDGMKRGIRRNSGDDAKKYPLIVNFSWLYVFMEANGISEDDIAVDPASIDTFYGGFATTDRALFFFSPTKSKVDEWWNYDCPTVYRYKVNKNRENNWFGINPLCFQNLICETSWLGVYVGEDITGQEVEQFAGARKHTAVYDAMVKMLDSRALTEGEIEKLKLDVEIYESRIQHTLDQNAEEILQAVAHLRGRDFGLDCGWLNIYTQNNEISDKLGLLKNIKGDRAKDDLRLKLPYFDQSITIMQAQFEAAVSVVSRELGERLYAKAILD